MKTVSASDAKQKLAAVIDAAGREPVVIRRQKRDVAVILSMREYEAGEEFSDRVGNRPHHR